MLPLSGSDQIMDKDQVILPDPHSIFHRDSTTESGKSRGDGVFHMMNNELL